MYKVLYRKYRPRFFSDVVGQPQITKTLQYEVENSRISHAYLFTGTRGTGKTTCAKIFAKAVNCLNPVHGDACGKCVSCLGADEGSLLDIMEIDAASNNGVDSIRTLIEESSFTPASAKYRVYIIDEVHMLSTAAFNALLKTLEEPPLHVIFILATTEVHRLLPTILSRCQRFDFRRIAPGDVADRLLYIAQQESAELDCDAALLIAQITDGTMRDAISILDQCLSRSQQVTQQVVTQAAGIADRGYLISLTDAVIESDAPEAILLIDTLYKGSKDMARLCEEMTEYFRGLMLTKAMRNPEGILNLSAKETQAMKAQASRLSLPIILNTLSVFETAHERMRYCNARTELEMCFVRLCHPKLDSSFDSVLQRIEQLEKGKVQQTASPAPISAPTPSSARTSIEGLSENAVPFHDWPDLLEQILDQLKGSSKSSAAAFRGSTAYTSGDYMLIDAPQLAFELMKRQAQRDQVRDIIRQATGRVYKLGPYKKADAQKQKDEDPLDTLTKGALESGIDVRQA